MWHFTILIICVIIRVSHVQIVYESMHLFKAFIVHEFYVVYLLLIWYTNNDIKQNVYALNKGYMNHY